MSANPTTIAGTPATTGYWFGLLDRVFAWLAGVAGNRAVFWATVVVAACLPWTAPRLPLIDLPQHAAQVALWRDLILGTSPWSELVRINLFTPYLAGYGLALPFMFIMPAASAMAVVLSLATAGFIAAAVALRKEFRADERLDWLVITPFFGFAWQWGFFTFLVVAPVVLVFVRLALRHARAATLRSGAWLTGLGMVLLFSHGLGFVFACAVGGALTLASARSVRAFVHASLPYLVLGLIFVAFFIVSAGFGAPSSAIIYGAKPLQRLVIALGGGAASMDFVVLNFLALCAPFVMRLGIEWRAAVPFGVLCLVMFVVPHQAIHTAFLFERFAMYTAPLLVVMFTRPATGQNRDCLRFRAGIVMMMLASWASLALLGSKQLAFARETADFEVVLAAAEPRKRALALIGDFKSPAAGYPFPYMHFASWYQADKQGLVDFNFAFFHPQVVRYRPGEVPKSSDSEYGWLSYKVEWHKHNARIYDYYFVRHGGKPLPAEIVDNGECRIETVAAAGAWTLLKRGACKP